MQKPPVSAATPIIPSRHDVGAVEEMVWCLPIPSRRTGDPLPIFSSVTLKVPRVLPIGVVRSSTTSPGGTLAHTRTGRSTDWGFVKYGLTSMPGTLNITVAPIRFLLWIYNVVYIPPE